MKKIPDCNKPKILKIVVTAAVLLLLTVGSFIIPLRPTVSETEKRELAVFPEFSPLAIIDGSYFSDIALWFSDTVPFRDTLVSLNTGIQNLLGTAAARAGFNEGIKGDEIPDIPSTPPETSSQTETSSAVPETTEAVTETTVAETEATTEAEPENVQQLSNILICDNAGYEYYNFVQKTADAYAGVLNKTAETLAGKAQVYSLIVPTSIDITLNKKVRATLSVSDQKKAIAYMYGSMVSSVKTVDVFDTLAEHSSEYIYFRTDHHWTGLGAYYAYTEFCKAKGTDALELSAYNKKTINNFLGSFYNDSGSSPELGDTPDSVETYSPPCETKMTVTDNSGNTAQRPMIFDSSGNIPSTKYSAFIFGDNAFSVIENLDKTEGESCLLIKDSYGNAFAPLLIYHYKYVYVYDFRYEKRTVKNIVDTYGIDDVIILDNISLTRDANQVGILASKIG